jgi:ketol-acid reductoisomerase
MAKRYYEQDGDLANLQGLKVAIVGYGSQGHAQAQNLRDSGVSVIVSEVEGTENYRRAKKDGFDPLPAAEVDALSIKLPPSKTKGLVTISPPLNGAYADTNPSTLSV